jgi:hypothetical protein
MKNLGKIIIPILIFSFLLISCEKEESSPKSYLKYNDTEYELSEGLLQYEGQWNNTSGGDVYYYYLLLYSNGFEVNEENGKFDELKGTGNAVQFNSIFTSQSDDIKLGSYTYDSEEPDDPEFNQVDAGTFGIYYIGININTETGEGTSLNINDGEINVKENGDNYVFKFTGKTVNGQNISFYYNGELMRY